MLISREIWLNLLLLNKRLIRKERKFMFSKKKLTAFVLSLVLSASCVGAASISSAAADTTTTVSETEETETETATEAPEEITSGEYTYHIDEEYGGAVITAYEPKEKDVILPEKIDGVTVVGLGDFIFNEQSQIETITIPKNVCHIGASAFYGTSIKEFFVEEGHSMYKTEDGILFSKDGIALIAYPPKKQDESYVVPEGVEELYHGCFASNTYIKDIKLPNTLKYIDTWAFAYTIIEQMEIPDTVTSIQSYAFAYMKRLTSIKTPPNLSVVESATFAGCSNLGDVTLNEGLIEIGQSAFAGTAVRSIVIPTTVEYIRYCALGYSEDLQTSYSTLVIYGLSGSIAQTYAADKDEEYDYKNNFTFVAKTSAQIKAMLSGDEENESSDSEKATEPDVVIKKEDNSTSQFTWKVIIIALGGIVLCGGVGSIAVSAKKNSKGKKD